MLRGAVENGTLARNVAAIRKAAKGRTEEIEILTPDQITAVLEGCRSRAASYRFTGARDGHEAR